MGGSIILGVGVAFLESARVLLEPGSLESAESLGNFSSSMRLDYLKFVCGIGLTLETC